RTSAVRFGDHWVLSGTKNFITQGTVGGLFVVMARTSPEKKKTQGITAFVLERGMKGFSQSPIHGKLGMRASDTAELRFEDVEVPDENRIGPIDGAFPDVLH